MYLDGAFVSRNISGLAFLAGMSSHLQHDKHQREIEFTHTMDKRQLGAMKAGFVVHVDCCSCLVALTRLLVR